MRCSPLRGRPRPTLSHCHSPTGRSAETEGVPHRYTSQRAQARSAGGREGQCFDRHLNDGVEWYSTDKDRMRGEGTGNIESVESHT